MAAHQQGKFWEYHDVLFQNQRALKKKNLIQYAQELGLDVRRFKRDLRDPKIALKVDNDTKACQLVGQNSRNQRGKPLGGTPAFYINGSPISGAQPYANFETIIAQEITKAQGLLSNGVPRNQVARQLTAASTQGGPFIMRFFFDETVLVDEAKPLPRYRVPIARDGRMFRGPKNAPLTLVHFTDLTQPASQAMDALIKKAEAKFPDKIRVLKKPHFPFSRDVSIRAFEALFAAEAQGKAWAMHDQLLTRSEGLGLSQLREAATAAGLDMTRYDKAMNERLFQKQVYVGLRAAMGVDVATPETLFINGTRIDQADFDDIVWTVEHELKVAAKNTLPGRTSDQLYAMLTSRGIYASATEGTMASFNLDGATLLGSPEAKIKIVEFSDFQCPYCSTVGEPFKKLVKAYPTQVALVFKNFPLSFHKEAKLCAYAALAAGKQGKFWEMHDLIFSLIQERIPRDQKAQVYPQKIQEFANQLRLNMAKFNRDLQHPDIHKQVESDMAEGSRSGVRGTPSIFINGQKLNMRVAKPDRLEPFLIADFGLELKRDGDVPN